MIKKITVKIDNENDWEFEVIDSGNGIKKVAVF